MESHGALVGWTHTDLGSQLLVCLESVQTRTAAEQHDPDVVRLLMTKSQAAVLGTWLMRASGHQPAPRTGWFRRLFG
jgi:hypothetical protein